MVIYLGADHRGFNLKNKIKNWLRERGYEVIDVGAERFEAEDDYTYYTQKLSNALLKNVDNSRGILFCGSGVGVCIAANRFKKIRAGLGLSPDQVFSARRDDDINILCVASDFLDEESTKKMIEVFLITPFDKKESHLRRINKLDEV